MTIPTLNGWKLLVAQGAAQERVTPHIKSLQAYGLWGIIWISTEPRVFIFGGLLNR
jgi:hypothetical protein